MTFKKKIIRTATIPASLSTFLNGTIEPLMDRYDLVLVSSPDSKLQELHEKYGVKIIGVPMERHISLTKDLKALIRLIKVFRTERPYMVHSMTPKAGMLSMVAARIARVPRRVHTFTGLVWPTSSGVKRRILMFADWLTCTCATHIVPEGQGVLKDLQNHITKKPMRVLGYGNVRGIDMEYWSRRPEVLTLAEKIKKPGIFTFLFVGRIVGDKGMNELMESLVRVLKRHNCRLILVGSYEESLDPVSQLTRTRIDNIPEIEAVGSKSSDELLAYYAASDCFVFPSYREGFPNTVLEAGAMELPSIVTNINGSREIIENGKNGVIIPSKDANALYKAMLNMVEDSETRDDMAKKSRPMIESRFEQGFVRKCLFDFYDEIM